MQNSIILGGNNKLLKPNTIRNKKNDELNLTLKSDNIITIRKPLL